MHVSGLIWFTQSKIFIHSGQNFLLNIKPDLKLIKSSQLSALCGITIIILMIFVRMLTSFFLCTQYFYLNNLYRYKYIYTLSFMCSFSLWFSQPFLAVSPAAAAVKRLRTLHQSHVAVSGFHMHSAALHHSPQWHMFYTPQFLGSTGVTVSPLNQQMGNTQLPANTRLTLKARHE